MQKQNKTKPNNNNNKTNKKTKNKKTNKNGLVVERLCSGEAIAVAISTNELSQGLIATSIMDHSLVPESITAHNWDKLASLKRNQ